LINLYILVLNEASIYIKRGKTRILQTFGDDIALPAPTLLFDNSVFLLCTIPKKLENPKRAVIFD